MAFVIFNIQLLILRFILKTFLIFALHLWLYYNQHQNFQSFTMSGDSEPTSESSLDHYLSFTQLYTIVNSFNFPPSVISQLLNDVSRYGRCRVVINFLTENFVWRYDSYERGIPFNWRITEILNKLLLNSDQTQMYTLCVQSLWQSSLTA